jgi:hypothetical protein
MKIDVAYAFPGTNERHFKHGIRLWYKAKGMPIRASLLQEFKKFSVV